MLYALLLLKMRGQFSFSGRMCVSLMQSQDQPSNTQVYMLPPLVMDPIYRPSWAKGASTFAIVESGRTYSIPLMSRYVLTNDTLHVYWHVTGEGGDMNLQYPLLRYRHALITSPIITSTSYQPPLTTTRQPLSYHPAHRRSHKTSKSTYHCSLSSWLLL